MTPSTVGVAAEQPARRAGRVGWPQICLIDLHRDGLRQGPGGDAETELALQLAGVDRTVPLKVADIGCGTGASSLLLARLLRNARITAVDLLPDFLDVLRSRARQLEELELELDVIWSEGTHTTSASQRVWRTGAVS